MTNASELQRMHDILIIMYSNARSPWYYLILDSVEKALQDPTNDVLINMLQDVVELAVVLSI